jgi:hypothetical protein
MDLTDGLLAWVAVTEKIATERGADSRAAGVRKAGDLTRWMVAGAVALTGALAAIAEHAVPGRSSTSRPPRPALRPRSSTPARSAPSDDAGQPAAPPLQPPAQPPQSADPGGGAVQSGGS